MSRLDPPDAADLLAIARATLQEAVIPHLQGDARFKALMIANAMAIAQRAAEGPEPEALPEAAAVCAAIRAGTHDDDAPLADRLRILAEQRCRISAPKALQRESGFEPGPKI